VTDFGHSGDDLTILILVILVSDFGQMTDFGHSGDNVLSFWGNSTVLRPKSQAI